MDVLKPVPKWLTKKAYPLLYAKINRQRSQTLSYTGDPAFIVEEDGVLGIKGVSPGLSYDICSGCAFAEREELDKIVKLLASETAYIYVEGSFDEYYDTIHLKFSSDEVMFFPLSRKALGAIDKYNTLVPETKVEAAASESELLGASLLRKEKAAEARRQKQIEEAKALLKTAGLDVEGIDFNALPKES